MSGGTWVLLRGLTREAGHWGDFVPLLTERLAPAQVVAIDLPGAGARWRESSPTSIAAITEDLRRQMLPLAAPRRLLGLSMGGMVALDWASRHPGDLAGVLLVNTSVRGTASFARRLQPARWPRLLQVLAARDAGAAESAILQLTSSRPAEHADVLAEWVELRRRHPIGPALALRQLLAAACFRLPAAAPAVPVRVLCSAGDALVDPACSHALAAAWSLPLAVHPTAGHDLPLDAPAWVAEQAQRLAAG